MVVMVLATTAGAQGAHRLVPIQRYGWKDASGATRPLTAAQKSLGGGMLGNVGGIVEGADGAVYVLDNLNLKVVVFNRDGSLRRVFAGDKGHEFAGPRSIALSDAGEVFVLDQKLSRIVVFDTAGTFKRVIAVGATNPLHLLVTHDRIYVDRVIEKGQPSVLGFDLKGTLVDKLVVPSAEEEGFARTGEAYALGQMRNGSVAVAYPSPGTWSLLSAPGKRIGKPLVANNRVWQYPGKEIFALPAGIRGFGEMADGTLLVYFMEYDPASFKPPYKGKVHYRLALMKPDGTLVETLTMTDDVRHILAIARNGKEVLLAVSSPFTQVVRYRLEAR